MGLLFAICAGMAAALEYWPDYPKITHGPAASLSHSIKWRNSAE
jgi:hypothetical protein